MIRSQEAFNFYSHLAGMLAAAIGTFFLILRATDSAPLMVTALIYGLSVVFLFLASSLYHAFKKQENELSFWRRMDRFAIFIMIAGSYTPVCYFFLNDDWRVPMIAIQWGLVAFGVLTQVFFPRAPRVVFTAIYLTMGWLLILPMQQVLASMTSAQEVLLLGGGAAFTAGALFYAAKRPLILPGIFSFHELFHVMVLVGASCHYALIYSAFAAHTVA
ncbi:MAG: hemolysin III family protein [Hahellaceae bacterium]|nr:hemolysin III family protein [Hahellaceae bacterium]MCP5168294.1 hemolysin III family protein [Hahellaceae bacterium]